MEFVREGEKTVVILKNVVERRVLGQAIRTCREVTKIRGEVEEPFATSFYDELLEALNLSATKSDSDRLKEIAEYLHKSFGFPKFTRAHFGKRAYTIKVTAQSVGVWERGDQKFEFLNYFPEDIIPYGISIGTHTMNVENQKGEILDKYVKRAEAKGFFYDTMPGRTTTKLSKPISLHDKRAFGQVGNFVLDLREIFREAFRLQKPVRKVLLSGQCSSCKTVFENAETIQWPYEIDRFAEVICPNCGALGFDSNRKDWSVRAC